MHFVCRRPGFHSYSLAMPLAFVCVILVRPLVARLVLHTVQT
jgi:hypothetical protein